MFRTNKLRSYYLILGLVLCLLLVPVVFRPIYPVQAAVQETQSVISPTLETEIAQSSGSASIPITMQFDSLFSPAWAQEFLSKSAVAGFQVRYIFQTIPVVSGYATPEAITKLASLNDVKTITYDEQRTVDPLEMSSLYSQLGLDTGYVNPSVTLDVNKLWSQGYNGTGVTVAVIDSGVDSDHPDFQGKLIGFYDLVNGRNDLTPGDGITAYDDNGHGTACAWLIAGSGEGTNYTYTGLAPGAKLLIVKALDSQGSADDSTIAQGIEYAVSRNVDVISLSIGGAWTESAQFPDASILAAQAAVQAGIMVVVAAGNSGPAASSITSPGVTQEVITVGASIGSTDVVAFSSRGPVIRNETTPMGVVAKPDVLAPGYEILSGITPTASANEYERITDPQFTADYALWSGTSAATPQIAAVAALLIDKHPGLSPIQLKTFLMAGATDLGADPMEEGYGLVNATKSSEMIANTSGILTIISPHRFPTLPGTEQVLIVGDVRSPQNATVISTVNRGVLDIEATGNASSFIVTDSQIDIRVGYSYFSIGLSVPDDLPLTALGRYVGFVSLISGNTTIASLDLHLLITSYGGRLLVDMGHQAPTDIDSVSYFRYFTEYLREQGMVISEYPTNWQQTVPNQNSAPFDANSLLTTETLMIMDTELTYTDTEIQLIHDFVNQGGTLLILSEGFDTQNNVPAFAFDSYNQILQPYGIQCENNWIGLGNGSVYGVASGGSVESDPLTTGVSNLFILNGGTFSVDSTNSTAKGLVWADSSKTHAIVAFAQAGKGRVIAISDGSILYDDTIYDAFQSGADNLRFLENLAKDIVPQRPRIYDVQFEHGDVGQEANFTAFIFGNDLASVNITITDPNGQTITAPVVATLGYKYFTGFTLEATGFYEVNIVATDSQGNVRYYTKTFLIPVQALNDQVLMAVVYSLVAIVGVALAYVGILKFGIGKKAKKTTEREWSPPWETDDGAPAIE
jgi:subtilisin family serine protease